MNSDIKFSIVIALYNSDTIESCIESIVNQTYKNYEIIVVDDCSNQDYSYLPSKYKNLKFIRSEENMGPGVTRQKGLNIATGDWVLFVDQDDMLHDNDVLSRVYSKCMEYQNAKIFEFGFSAIIPTFKDDESTERVVPELTDMRPLHGLIFNHQFIKDNGIRFHESLRWHEDAFFYLTCKAIIMSTYTHMEDVYIKFLDDIIYDYYNIKLDKSITHRMYGMYTFYEVSLFDHITMFSGLYEQLKGKIKDEYLKDLTFCAMINMIAGYINIYDNQSHVPYRQRNLMRVHIFSIKVFDLLFEKYGIIEPLEMYGILQDIIERRRFEVYIHGLIYYQPEGRLLEILNSLYDMYLKNRYVK